MGRACAAALMAAVLVAAAPACSPVSDTVKELDLDWNRMLDQPKVKAYDESSFYDDGLAMRVPPAGTVRWSGQHPLRPEPPELDRALLERGRRHFDIFCAACHGKDGRADTVVASKMTLRPPPSLHTARIRDLSDRRLYRVVTEGYGLMPSYESRIGFRDRWAVVHYLRALQLSQHARVAELPQPLRDELKREAP